MKKRMVELIGRPAMYDLLAEECNELAHAAQKMSRILRKENPTPKKAIDVRKNLIEEVTDVDICLKELDLEPDKKLKRKKTTRFFKRWKIWKKNNKSL